MVEMRWGKGRARRDDPDCTGSNGHLRFAPRSLPWRAARHPVKSQRWPTAARLARGRLRLPEQAEVCCVRHSAQRARVCAPQRAARCTVRNARCGVQRAYVHPSPHPSPLALPLFHVSVLPRCAAIRRRVGGGGSGKPQGILRYYTDDVPGLKISPVRALRCVCGCLLRPCCV